MNPDNTRNLSADPENARVGFHAVIGAHFFPLGGFEKSAAWANAVVAGEFEIKADGFDLRDGTARSR